MTRHAKLNNAFTLIELLVVISIIALLISILLPALAATRQAAKQVQCGTQIRQQFMSFTHYANDNKGNFPYLYWGSANTIGQTRIRKGYMRGYFGDNTIVINDTYRGPLMMLLCPDRDPRLRTSYLNYGSGTTDVNGLTATTYRYVLGRADFSSTLDTAPYYGWANYTFTNGNAAPVVSQEMVGKVKHGSGTEKPLAPSDQPGIGDLYNPPAVGLSIYGGVWYGISGRVKNNHAKGSNTAFADGHVVFKHNDDLTKNISFYTPDKLWF